MAAYELKYTAEEIDGILESVDEKTIYGDATQSAHGLMSVEDKSKLDALPTSQQIESSLSGKVDKENGKGLSTNDYDATAKGKVDAIPQNPQYTDTVYDDTALSGRVSAIEGKESGWDAKQDALVSGTNIKTVNGESLLGGGNIEIQGGGEENVIEAITMNDAPVPVANKTAAITETDPTVPSWAKQPNKPSYDYSEIGNTPDLSGFITKSVNDLTNYYLKGETYTKAEVQALIGAIQNFHYEFYASTSAVTNPQGNVLYLIGPTGTGADRYEEYVYSNSVFTKIGDTSIDLSGYVTTSALNTALADYTPTSNLAPVATSGSYNDLDDKPTIPQPEVFWATYGTTTAAEIATAVAAGKIVMCARNDYIYILHVDNSSAYFFTASIASGITYLYLNKTSNAWSNGELTAEKIGDKVSTIVGNETNTTKYPNTKAVADALGKWGVVSQTQTWSGTGTQPRTYVMSDLVYGTIPQANIDLFESAGATFNATSGYFELNGLNDISYEEMKVIYNTSVDNLSYRVDRQYQYYAKKLRTVLPFYFNTYTGFSTNWSSIFAGICSIERISSTANTVKFTSSTGAMFRDCSYLKEIPFVLDFVNKTSFDGLVFYHCYSLEKVLIKNLKNALDFKDCSLLGLDSFVYIVENAANTSAITITLHADALARCTADTTEYEYNDNTYTGIVALATAKNITLASA